MDWKGYAKNFSPRYPMRDNRNKRMFFDQDIFIDIRQMDHRKIL